MNISNTQSPQVKYLKIIDFGPIKFEESVKAFSVLPTRTYRSEFSHILQTKTYSQSSRKVKLYIFKFIVNRHHNRAYLCH